MIPFGREFFKLSGPVNDFVFVDTRDQPAGVLASPEGVGAICRRGAGSGAAGAVFIEDATSAHVRRIYLTADGARAELCGNATLCPARVARELAIIVSGEFTIETDVGALQARFRNGIPEIDLQPVSEVQPEAAIPLERGESRMGYAV